MSRPTFFSILLLLTFLCTAHAQCICPSPEPNASVCCQPSRGPPRTFPSACECTCVPGNIILPSSACPLPTPAAVAAATTAPTATVVRTPPPPAPRTLAQYFAYNPCAILRCAMGYACVIKADGNPTCTPIPGAFTAVATEAPRNAVVNEATPESEIMPTSDDVILVGAEATVVPEASSFPESSPEVDECVCTRELNEICCESDTGIRTLPNPCTCGCFNGTIVPKNRC